MTTLAGVPGGSGSIDGTGSNVGTNKARFNCPAAVAVDSATNIYVADCFNHTIRKITPAGVVSTLAGLPGVWGNADGTNSAARFYEPAGIAVDSGGNRLCVGFGQSHDTEAGAGGDELGGEHGGRFGGGERQRRRPGERRAV